MICGSSPRIRGGASSSRRWTPRRSSARSTARISGARRQRISACRPSKSRPRRRAARRRSSTARCSIRITRPLTSRASRSSASRSEALSEWARNAFARRNNRAVHMAMLMTKLESARAASPVATARVLPLKAPKRPLVDRLGTVIGNIASRVVPPLVVLAAALLVWELLCRKSGATLPPPSAVVRDTWELIVDPFYDRGGIDKGLFWHLSASLQRVALGYALASAAGIALGTLVGQSTWAMRGLDPIFQVLRTVPPLAWLPLSLAAFRDGQPSAIFVIFITAIWPIIINTAVGIRNIPQDYRNVARVL